MAESCRHCTTRVHIIYCIAHVFTSETMLYMYLQNTSKSLHSVCVRVFITIALFLLPCITCSRFQLSFNTLSPVSVNTPCLRTGYVRKWVDTLVCRQLAPLAKPSIRSVDQWTSAATCTFISHGSLNRQIHVTFFVTRALLVSCFDTFFTFRLHTVLFVLWITHLCNVYTQKAH